MLHILSKELKGGERKNYLKWCSSLVVRKNADFEPQWLSVHVTFDTFTLQGQDLGTVMK